LPAIHQGLRQRGRPAPAALTDWGTDLARQLLAGGEQAAASWQFVPLSSAENGAANPWLLQQRPSSDGMQAVFLCSLPRGEQLTGILRSAPFAIPAQLTFYLAGHSGFPDKPISSKNYIQLCDAATGEVLARTSPPRNDTAQRVKWNLSAFADRRGYLEVVDGDTAGAYAWLAAGRFQPPIVAMPAVSPSLGSERELAALEMIAALRIKELLSDVQGVLRRETVESAVAAAAARAVLAFTPDARGEALAVALADGRLAPELERQTRKTAAQPDHEQVERVLADIMQHAPAALQQSLATALAADERGADTLLRLVQQGRASPRLLQFGVVAQRLQSLRNDELSTRVATLTAALPAAKEDMEQLIEQRRKQFPQASPDLENGAQVFTRVCAACHQIGGKGAVVGPQLDGIGNRGLDRLLEDLLDPSRNVDVAFRSSVLQLTSGQVVSGLQRGERGELLVLFDDKGKEFTVPKSDVEEQAVSPLSLMPENATSALAPAEFYDLVAYLLAQRAAEPKE
jgi:putative heme-binding domain-containing protein